MYSRPKEVNDALDELFKHYDDFDENTRGANGYLFFAKNRVSGSQVAIKFYAGEAGDRRHDEPRQLSSINSLNVLSILDARSVSEDWAYFITPKCSEGDLDDFIKCRPSVHEAIGVALGICAGVSSIHLLNMLHRDLKPGNIVLHEKIPRIADFGSVRAIANGEEDVTASKHSILYRPPESFASDRYSIKGDVYQIGLVTYQLLGGKLPYDGMHYLNAKEKKAHSRIEDNIDKSLYVDSVIRRLAERGELVRFESMPPWITQSVKRELRAMTNPNPKERLAVVADVAASLTRMRAKLADWKYKNDNVQVMLDGRLIELRPNSSGAYVAFQKKDSDFRKMPTIKPNSLVELVKHFSKQ